MHTRDDVKTKLRIFLQDHPKVLAAWEGGSAATDALDAYSDLDVLVVAEESDTEDLFQEIDALFAEHFGITDTLRLPEPTWHGFAQKFYELENTEPWFYVDLCILPETTEDPFTAADRHGEVVVWKDTIDIVNKDPSSEDAVQKRAEAFYERATQGTFVLRKEIDKAFRRDHYLDAYHFLYAFVMRSLVPLLNMEHRIAKVDFGIRYADRDYSTEDYDLLMRFFRVSDLEGLKRIAKDLMLRYEQLKKTHEPKK